MKQVALFLIMIVGSISAGLPTSRYDSTATQDSHLQILLVVAHPDDEYDMAATVYRITTELHGVADEIIITNGESGYRYASLAERYYGITLTDESSSQKRLGQIRAEESQRAAKILGIRQQWFLGEKNIAYTRSPNSPLSETWHADRIAQKITEQLRTGNYEYVFVLLPDAETHGEHKAAAILTLQSVSQLPSGNRPVVLGAAAGNMTDTRYLPLEPKSLTRTLTPAPEFRFDRDTRFGYNASLSYQIVVDWVIAEHKSQGLFQTKCLQDRYERFWIFDVGDSASDRKAAELFAEVTRHPAAPEAQQGAPTTKALSQN